MMRSLWTAATGMTAQQLQVDTIANNLANINTVGFKRERIEFKSLIYENLREANTNDRGDGRPVNLLAGHGVRPVATAKSFTQGNIERTDNPLDIGIEGDGFYVVQLPNGAHRYTKDGTLKLSLAEEGLMITTADGYAVLDVEDQPIILPQDTYLANVSVAENGAITYKRNGVNEDLGVRFQLVQFNNPLGLKAVGGTLFDTTVASGEPMKEAENEELEQSRFMQGTLERSNVNAVDEMVNLIVAQRAYEINSKAIQTSDDMLGIANQLKR
ncbi:MAG: flagellar basal-body rod protein FlgG [Eubacteriales bacterium]|nr:flagellar basal-body rod protein FlgG [Eubacteriales bacterium]